MQRPVLIALGALAVALGPALHFRPGQAQEKAQPGVQLRLVVDRQIVQKEETGRLRVTWQEIAGKVSVQPGEILRYTVYGTNAGDRPVENLAITQPVPRGAEYLAESAVRDSERKLPLEVRYSADRGQTFVERPTVEVKLPNGAVVTRPAAPAAYTHVRWSLAKPLPPQTTVRVAYRVKVR
jgi:uncharacterized repeat protein (TIGR01451 family)